MTRGARARCRARGAIAVVTFGSNERPHLHLALSTGGQEAIRQE